MYSTEILQRQVRQPVLVTAAAVQPLTVAEAKAQCRILDNFEDALLADYIAAASRMVEEDAEIALMSATYALYLDAFPDWCIELRKPPVTSVSSITYVDTDGTTQTLASTEYRSDLKHSPCRIEPAYGEVWPSTQDTSNAVTVTFVAGASSQSGIPALARHAIRMLVDHWYNNRSPVGRVGAEIDLSYGSLINSLRWAGGV